VAITREETRHLDRLNTLLERSGRRRLRELSEDELVELPRLYRFASSLLARLETQGSDPGLRQATRDLVRRSHTLLHRPLERDRRSLGRRTLELLLVDSPRALRAEWRLLVGTLAFFYGLAGIAFAAVSQDLELAFTLLDPAAVANEIQQLEATREGEPFRGNFTFGLGDSPGTAGWILAHNMGVSVLFFVSGLVLPLFLYVLASNALMVGTYTAVAAHWDQGWAISSILWCHGMLELQAIVIAGMAGLVLVRPWFAPGPWSRAEAMRRGTRRALLVLAPVFPMLLIAGLIEGFISPHAPTAVRLTVAAVTGALFLGWLLLAGRGEESSRASA